MADEQYVALVVDAIALGRALLVQAMTQGKFELALELYQSIRCQEFQLRIITKE